VASEKQPTRGGDMLTRSADSHAEIAAKVGVDKSLVTRWVTGERKPTRAQVEKLDALYGIPPAAWSEPPPPRAPRAPSLPASTPEVEDNNARLQRTIRNGLDELELDTETSGVKRAEALKKLVDAQVSLDKSTGENALTMTKIVAHPEFRRMIEDVTQALVPYPEALAAVVAVLKAAA
jgi:transcriptional regulator with XRE-family HTH domain